MCTTVILQLMSSVLLEKELVNAGKQAALDASLVLGPLVSEMKHLPGAIVDTLPQDEGVGWMVRTDSGQGCSCTIVEPIGPATEEPFRLLKIPLFILLRSLEKVHGLSGIWLIICEDLPSRLKVYKASTEDTIEHIVGHYRARPQSQLQDWEYDMNVAFFIEPSR